MAYDLSILIPARNEEFLTQTIEDILKNKRGKTEVLVGLDGYWPDPGIPQHPDVTVLHVEESIGQRAMQNRLAKISQAKYVAKTDAHCAFDEGFDIKLIEAMERATQERGTDNITMVPVMRNLHVFNWVCKQCGLETYQGPKPDFCRNETCAPLDDNDVPTDRPTEFEKKIVWIPKTNPQSSAYRFNKNLQFKYFPELRAKLGRSGLQETMSLQGSFFMCTRENYWKYDLCDESWGSWGQQGSEVAIKTWLSGGYVLCHMDTWYAHLFRTQKGFSFPYPTSGNDQQKARKISQDTFLNDGWDKQVRPISWLIEKFWFALKEVQDPEARWEASDLERATFNRRSKGIIFYTDNQLTLKIAHKVQKQLKKISAEKGLPIVSASLKPMSLGTNFVINEPRGYHAYFKQIITALENLDTDIVYFCEHDVLYHPSHFDFVPSDENTFYYNLNVWRLKYPEDFAVTWEARQVAQLVCYRKLALNWYRNKLAEYERVGREKFNRKFEPEDKFEHFRSEEANIDIRHDHNLTKSKWSIADFRDKSTCINWQEGTCPRWAKEI